MRRPATSTICLPGCDVKRALNRQGGRLPGPTTRLVAMKQETVVKQLYRLNVEPRVIDQLSKLALRTGEPKTRIATRLFTEAVMGFKPPAKKNGAKP